MSLISFPIKKYVFLKKKKIIYLNIKQLKKKIKKHYYIRRLLLKKLKNIKYKKNLIRYVNFIKYKTNSYINKLFFIYNKIINEHHYSNYYLKDKKIFNYYKKKLKVNYIKNAYKKNLKKLKINSIKNYYKKNELKKIKKKKMINIFSKIELQQKYFIYNVSKFKKLKFKYERRKYKYKRYKINNSKIKIRIKKKIKLIKMSNDDNKSLQLNKNKLDNIFNKYIPLNIYNIDYIKYQINFNNMNKEVDTFLLFEIFINNIILNKKKKIIKLKYKINKYKYKIKNYNKLNLKKKINFIF